MQKVACIFSFKMSSWVSCQKIVFNLHKSYQLNKDLELLNFNYSVDQNSLEVLQTAQAIEAAQPDTIIILDHKPHPLNLFQLLQNYLKTKKPRIIVHVFGDFTLYYAHWDKLGKLVEGLQVDFIVASHRQKDLLDKFLPENNKAHVCPFPVDKHEFSYIPSLRKLQRKEWGISDKDYVFTFTGRLSRQKRIHTVLRAFHDFLQETDAKNAHLFLYGATDHIGDQFVGKWEIEGEYFRKINKIYRSLPEETQNKIHFMGAVPNVELKAIYQGADMLLNVSVHNDEDYGMSVAEAQCSGLPAIITDWGGLASFYNKDQPYAISLIPVKIGQTSKLIHYKSSVKAMVEAWKRDKSENRKAISEAALGRYSVEKCHEILTDVIDQKGEPFTKFSPFFKKVVKQYLFRSTPYIDDYKNINKLYREIYSSYVRNNSKSV